MLSPLFDGETVRLTPRCLVLEEGAYMLFTSLVPEREFERRFGHLESCASPE